MIRSMTGFGEAERETPAGRLKAEIRAVNHRYFSANLRLARSVERFEPQIREALRTYLPRGHVNLTLRLEREGAAAEGPALTVDLGRARQYLNALATLKSELGITGDVDLAMLTRMGDLIVPEDETEVEPVAAADVVALIEAAAQSAIRMREEEGLRLAVDLEARLVAMETALAGIERAAPARMHSERDRMRRVVSELLAGRPLDEDRVAKEIAFIAERWDISEELVRMRSHLELFRETVAADASEPVGKRLGFLIQEMHRETNTIGSKANDAAIEHLVIAIKDEIERLREQVENVE